MYLLHSAQIFVWYIGLYMAPSDMYNVRSRQINYILKMWNSLWDRCDRARGLVIILLFFVFFLYFHHMSVLFRCAPSNMDLHEYEYWVYTLRWWGLLRFSRARLLCNVLCSRCPSSSSLTVYIISFDILLWPFGRYIFIFPFVVAVFFSFFFCKRVLTWILHRCMVLSTVCFK